MIHGTTPEYPEAPIVAVAHELTDNHPSLQIVGSLGRAAHMGVAFNETRQSGVRRDIDVWRGNERSDPLPAGDDLMIDTIFESWIKPEANGTWLVFPHDPSLAVEVPYAEDVFAPQEIDIEGATIRVPHAQTLGAISTMMYISRPKDKEAMRVYDDYLSSRPTSDRLPDELLRPFAEFRSALAERKAYVGISHIRNMYHILVPEKQRKKIRFRQRTPWVRGH